MTTTLSSLPLPPSSWQHGEWVGELGATSPLMCRGDQCTTELWALSYRRVASPSAYLETMEGCDKNNSHDFS